MTVAPETPRQPHEHRKIVAHHPGCFGCGEGNGHGLALRPAWDDGDVMRFEHVPPPHSEGGPGVAHGGYLSALADEVMQMVAADQAGGPVMTRRVQVDYLSPTLVGVPLTVRAFVEETRRRSIVVRLEADAGDPARRCFEARGVFLGVPRELWVKAMHSQGRAPDRVDWDGDPSAFLRWQLGGGLQEIYRPELLRRPLRVAVTVTDADPSTWTIEATTTGLDAVPELRPDPRAHFHGSFRAFQRLVRASATVPDLVADGDVRVDGDPGALTDLAVALDYRRFQ